MLPALDSARLSLADVLPSCLASIRGSGENRLGLPSADRAIVLLVDGLGSDALRFRSGHARFLANLLDRGSTMFSGFPATTVAGIASLATGQPSGTHGLVAYRVRDEERDRVVNQLTGWDDGMPPETWQRATTVFEQASALGVRTTAIGPEKFRNSGFSKAVLRGADYVAGRSIADRFAAARRVLDAGGAQLIYVYVSELDVIAHAVGAESVKWLEQLEALDGAVAAFASLLGPREGLLVTADHGVLDVPEHSHVLFGDDPRLVAGIRHIAGDPRCLHLYFEPDITAAARDELVQAWRDSEQERAWVASREEAIDAGWFGAVAPEVLPRIGDIIVAARKRVAYYDQRDPEDGGPPDQKARRMIGQHGSLTPEETLVPLIRLGAFTR